jgi:hypothetical protein
LAKCPDKDRADEPAEPDPDDAKGSPQVAGALGLAILSTLAADKATTVLSGLPAAVGGGASVGPRRRLPHRVCGRRRVYGGAGATLPVLVLRPSDVQPSGVQQIDVEEPLEAAA